MLKYYIIISNKVFTIYHSSILKQIGYFPLFISVNNKITEYTTVIFH